MFGASAAPLCYAAAGYPQYGSLAAPTSRPLAGLALLLSLCQNAREYVYQFQLYIVAY